MSSSTHVPGTIDPASGMDGIRARADRVLAPTYARDLVLADAEGARVTDADGRTYLDATSGIAVTALGHRAQVVADAIKDAADGPLHVSNLFHTEPAVALAELLVETSFADRVFFTNSGAEAVEAAIKFARLHAASADDARPDDASLDGMSPVWRHEVVFAEGSFHGRTLGALAATDREDYQRPFRPLPGGYRRMAWNDTDDVSRAITDRTAAVLVEPVQGEGGVRVADPEWLRAVESRCREMGALLVVDEIQCGLGRTGRLWAHAHAGIVPDLLTAAKPLAGGLPMGAVLMTDHVASSLHPGCHGSTFAGGPFVARVAAEVVRTVARPDFLSGVGDRSERLRVLLEEKVMPHPRALELRGVGLLLGVQVVAPVGDVVAAAREAGLLVVPAAGDVVRLLPPLTVSDHDLTEIAARLRTALDTLGDPS